MGSIGDSRAILATQDNSGSMVAVQLTVDLKPDLPSKNFDFFYFVFVVLRMSLCEPELF